MERWKHKTQDLKGQKNLLEHAHARMQRILDEKASLLNALAETLLKPLRLPDCLKEGHVGTGNLEAKEKRDAENECHPADLSEADLKHLIDAVNLKLSLKRHKEEKEKYQENCMKQIKSMKSLWDKEKASKLSKHPCRWKIHSLKVRFRSFGWNSGCCLNYIRSV